MLRQNPAGRVELETVPVAVITAIMDNMRISSNDEINLISDSDSESDEEPIVSSVRMEAVPEQPRFSEYRPKDLTSRPEMSQKTRLPGQSDQVSLIGQADWDIIMDNIRNLVTTEIGRANETRSMTPQSPQAVPSPLAMHSRPASAGPMVNISITPTKSSAKRRK